MKLSKRFLVFSLLSASLVGFGLMVKVSAQDEPMTQDQINTVLTNCTSATNTLNQLHASDALLRVNMGQEYESALTKLMTGFNGRIANNGFSNDILKAISSSYSGTLNKFRSDYISYESNLSGAIKTNCLKQPTAFYTAVDKARQSRIKLHDDVIKLNEYIEQYRVELDNFEAEYIAATKGNK